MLNFLSDYIDYPFLSSERRLFIFQRLRELARLYGADDVVLLCDLLIVSEKNLIAMKQKLSSVQASKADPRLMTLDPKVDHFTGLIFRSFKDQASGYRDEPRGDAAAKLMLNCYPNGAGAITRLAYVEQGPVVANLVDSLQNEYAALVALLEVGSFVNSLREKNDEFCEILQEGKEEELSSEEVRNQNKEGQLNLLKVLVLTLGICAQMPKGSEKDIKALLKPFVEQAEAVRQRRKIKKAASDKKKDTEETNTNDSDDAPDDPHTDDHTHNINLTMD